MLRLHGKKIVSLYGNRTAAPQATVLYPYMKKDPGESPLEI